MARCLFSALDAMPRINRRARALAQPRRSRAQVLELLIGPNGKSAFRSEEQRLEVWDLVRLEIRTEFAIQWYASQTARKPFAAMAETYARQVVAGEVETCKWVKLACRRHLDDLARAVSGNWDYEFDVAKAERACRFIELLPHTKGKWAADGELMVLQPWQAFFVCSIFGWVKRVSRLRRFSLAYMEVARKNAKSQLAACIGLYATTADGEFGAEVYSGATSEKQAFEVFRPALLMMERSPELAQVLGVTVAAAKLSVGADGSRFEPVVRDPGDGASPHVGIVDEYHEHDADALVDTFRTGMGARQQPLLLIITTAGSNMEGPCKALQGDVTKMLDGLLPRPEMFGIIYTIDEGDSWTSMTALRKPNPNIDVSVYLDFLVTEQNAARMNARKQGVFQTKHQCVWVGANMAYFNVQRWNELVDPAMDAEYLIGEACVIANDLSTKRDFTARISTFKKIVGGKYHYFVFPTFYLPKAQVLRPECQHYQKWDTEKHLKVHEGETIDFDIVQEETVEEIRKFKPSEFCYDPFNAAQFSQGIGKLVRSVEVVEIDQRTKNLSPGMKELDVLIAEGRIHHDGNPILTWMIGNVTAHEDANEEVFPRKESHREENKIDGAVALIMTIGRLMGVNVEPSVYESRGVLVI